MFNITLTIDKLNQFDEKIMENGFKQISEDLKLF